MSNRMSGIFALVTLAGLIGMFIYALNSGMNRQRSQKEQWMVDYPWVVEGTFARVRLTGDKVQIRTVYPNSKQVECLVAAGRRYRDGIVSADSFKTEYVSIWFNIAELEPWKEEEI